MFRVILNNHFWGVLMTLWFLAAQSVQQKEGMNILTGVNLAEGFDIGLDTSRQKRDWFSKEDGYMKMAFPANQEWAALFITVGRSTQPPRPYKDLSAYQTLSVEMKGASGGERIEIGIKSNDQPDDGRESRVSLELKPEWKTYTIPLARFGGADLKHLYVVTEFVYNGETAQTVYFRNIKYLK